MPTPNQIRLKAVLDEIGGLKTKASLTNDEETKFQRLLEEGSGLKSAIQRESSADELADWATKSAGFLPLAAAKTTLAEVEGSRPAGAATVEKKGKSVLVTDEGEALLDEKTIKTLRDPEYARAFRSYLRLGLHGMKSSDGLKVLQEGSDTAGGYLVPEDILSRIVAREATPARIAGLVTQLNTSRDALVMPKVNYSTDDIYTTGIRATWTGEIPASASGHRVTEPVFGQIRIPVFTAMLSMPLTNDMVEDAAFPIVNWASGKFGETIELLKDNMVLNGTGIGQPSGILLNPGGANQPAVVNSGAAAALTGQGVVDLAFALPEQYDQNARFVFNKTSTGKALASLKDGQSRFLWGSGMQDSGLSVGWKDRALLGYPTVLSGFMPNVGASAYPIAFGDFSGYYLVNRIGFSIQVLRELYAETNQILLLGRTRFGGLVAEDWKLKLQCVSA
jgi:HK97 family phage major capsid protein